MDYYLIIYFIAGVLLDTLFTLKLRFVADEEIFPAAFVSFLVTALTLFVFYNILNQINAQRGLGAIGFYSVGIGVGTVVAMKIKSGAK